MLSSWKYVVWHMKKTKPALVLLLLSIFCPLFLFSQSIKEGYFNRTKLGVLPGLTNEEGSPFKQRGTETSNINGWYINTNIQQRKLFFNEQEI